MERRTVIIGMCVIALIVVSPKIRLRSNDEEAPAAEEKKDEKPKSKTDKVKDFFSGAAEDFKQELATGISKFGVAFFQQEINKNNSYRGTAGYVRERIQPSWSEQQYKTKRLAQVVKAQNSYFKQSLSQRNALKIGIACGGNGYRSMILTAGYMEGLSSLGLIDASMYISASSGASWFVAPWLLHGSSVSRVKDSWIQKIQNGKFDIPDLIEKTSFDDVKRLVEDVIWPKFVFEQPISAVDIYGSLLSDVLLSDFGESVQRKHLSQLWRYVNVGQNPFPIFTAVSMTKESENTYRYNWYECNPLEIRNNDYGIAIDTFAFGRNVKGGKTVDFGPEQTLGYMMGVFGSFFSANPKEIKSAWSKKLNNYKADSLIDTLKVEAAKLIINSLESEKTIATKRLSPAQLNNPWKDIPDGTGHDIPNHLKERDTITLVDSTVDFDIPIAPLLEPVRDLDVIVIVDSSDLIRQGNVEHQSLKKALKYAESKGYWYAKYDELSKYTNSVVHLYKDYTNDSAPVLIHINYQSDEILFSSSKDLKARQLVVEYDLRNFNTIKCTQSGHCQVFNFNYSVEQMLQLAAQAEFNIRANKDLIYGVLEETLKEKHVRNQDSYVPNAADLMQRYETQGF